MAIFSRRTIQYFLDRNRQCFLAGNIGHDDFTSDHKELSALFRQKLLSGQLPSSIEIEHEKDLDDDWVRFIFKSQKDPAVSCFE